MLFAAALCSEQLIACPAAFLSDCRTLQDVVLQAYVSPEHYFLQIDPEAQGGRPAGLGSTSC